MLQSPSQPRSEFSNDTHRTTQPHSHHPCGRSCASWCPQAGSIPLTKLGPCCARPRYCRREARAKDETFNSAVRSLRDLGLLTADGDQLSLAPPARSLAADDADGFAAALRAAVLEPTGTLT